MKIIASGMLSAALCVTVTQAQAGTQAIPDHFSTIENNRLDITVQQLLDNDVNPYLQSLDLNYVDDWENGQLIYDQNTGVLSFTPSPNYTGTAGFTYGITDSQGDRAWARVTIDIQEAYSDEQTSKEQPDKSQVDQSSPITLEQVTTATPDHLTTTKNTPLNISVQEILSNDVNPYQEPLDLNYVDDWENGNLVYDQNTGTLTFTPNDEFIGLAGFMYGVADIHGERAWAKVTIEVSEAENEPSNGNTQTSIVEPNDLFSTPQNVELNLTAQQLLSNDTYAPSLAIVYVDDWNNGVLSFNSDKTVFQFTPTQGFSGIASFTYGARDITVADSEMHYAVVYIDVVEGEESLENVTPTAIDDIFATSINSTLNLLTTQLLSNDFDENSGDEISIAYVDDWYNGHLQFDQQAGRLTFTPESDFSGTAGFSYAIRDSQGELAYAQVTIEVDGEQEQTTEIVESETAQKFSEIFANKSLMGMNLTGEVYYSAPDIYKDKMRAADPWKTFDSTQARWTNDIYFSQIPKRADGYPTHVPFNVSGSDLPQRVLTQISAGDRNNTGIHHVLFKGQGEFSISGASFVREVGPGHHIYDFGEQVGGDKVLAVQRSEVSDPLHGIEIVHEDDLDTYKDQPFNDKLLSSLDDISVVRLMDLMFTNGNAAESAAHIPPVDYYTWNDCPGDVCNLYGFAGHPPEVLMQLVDHIDVNPWITIPHKADDGYIREYAQRILNSLDEDKFLFIEYSNELWNWLFPQTTWLGQQGCENPITRIEYTEGESGRCDIEISSRRFHTKRSLEIFAIFKEVFAERQSQIVTVLAGQGSWTHRTELSLAALNDQEINPNGQTIDALAIAPYFGGYPHLNSQEIRDAFVNASFEELRSQAFDDIDSAEVRGGVREHKSLASQYGMQLIAYEGGQHYLCGFNEDTGEDFCTDTELREKLTAFQRHDVMEDIYDYYYDMWFSEGGSLFAVFSHMGSAEGRWGAWGTLEHYGQPLSETPKRRALITASERYRGEAAGEQGEQNEQPEQQQGSEQSGNNEQEQAGENQPNEAEAKDGRNTYIFGHSLILHENSTESNELTQVPNWLHLLSDSADKDFSVSGQYGFLPQHTNFAPSIEDTPLEGYSPFPQWGFELADAAWSDETGENFADVNFDSILLTAAYFIQYQSANTPYDGDNPTQTTPLAETQKIIDWVRRAEPGIDIYIYENWPDLPLAVNPATFPMTAQQLAEYHQATMNDDVGGFHRWWLDYHDDLVAANPAVNVKMIPVGPTMAKVLSHERFSTLTTNDLFEDDALHGRASVYFIASLVTYMGMYGEQPPEDFVIPEAVHPLIRQHYTDIVETIWHELSVFNFDNGQSRIW